MNETAASTIAQWVYDAPYEMYSFRGHPNDYLLNTSVWGVEQFCLMAGGQLIGQVACQYEGDDLWVGWAMTPELCGKGLGAAFVQHCVAELRRVKEHEGILLLRVAASNQRAVKAYQKAGFQLVDTVRDEVAYSGITEDFYIMKV